MSFQKINKQPETKQPNAIYRRKECRKQRNF